VSIRTTVSLAFEIRLVERHKHYDAERTMTPDRFAVLFVNGREMEHVGRGSKCPRRETCQVPDVSKLRRNALESYPWIEWPRGAKVGATWTQAREAEVLSAWDSGDVEPAEADDAMFGSAHKGFLVSFAVDGDDYHTHDIEVPVENVPGAVTEFAVGHKVAYGERSMVTGIVKGTVVTVDPSGDMVAVVTPATTVEFTRRLPSNEFHLRGTALIHDVTRLRMRAS
jgi:hypothetical protein